MSGGFPGVLPFGPTYRLACLDMSEIILKGTLNRIKKMDSIFFLLAGIKGMQNEFEFQQDSTTDYRIICPWASEKLTYNFVATFLIGSSSFLLVMRTAIKSRMSTKFG